MRRGRPFGFWVSNRFWLVLFVLLAFALRLYRLDFQSLRGDEAVSVIYSSQGWAVIVELLKKVDVHPPLYYSFLDFWMPLVGKSEFSARFPSLSFGVLSLPLIYRFGRRLLGSQAGLLAALIMAINPFQVWFSQDARMYTLWVALVLSSSLVLLRALQEERGLLWIAYIVSMASAFYTHYYTIFILLFENIFFLLYRRRYRGLLGQWFAAQAAIGLLYLPWLALGLSQIRAYGGTGSSPDLWAMLQGSIAAFSLGLTVDPGVARVLVIFFSSLLLLGLWRAWREHRSASVLLGLFILVPMVALFFLSRSRALFRERYLIAIAPAYYLAYANGLAIFKGRRGRRVFVGLGLSFIVATSAYSLGNYFFVPRYAKSPDWRSLATHMEASVQEGEIIIQNHRDQAFLYYYEGQAPLIVLPLGTPPNFEATGERLERIAARYQRIWLLPDEVGSWDPRGFVESWLGAHGQLVDEEDVAGFRLPVYLPSLVSLQEIDHPLSFRLGEAVSLIGYNLRPDDDPLEPGGSFRLTLYWQALASMEKDYTVFTHLIDEEGQIWAQKDSPPLGGARPTSLWYEGEIIKDEYELIVKGETPPGEYLLEVGMYLAESGARLPVYSIEGELLGDRILLPTETEVAP